MSEPPDQWRSAINASVFGSVPAATVSALFDGAREAEYPAKAGLYHEDESPDTAHLMLVLSGLVRVYRTAESGREVTLRHARRGDVLGLPSVVANVSPAAARAMSPTRVVVMSAGQLRGRAQHDGALAWAIAEEMAGSLFNIQERLAHNVFAPVRSRVARYLLDIATPEGERMVATSSHEDIAAAIGTVREVVARALTGLRTDGLTDRVDTGIVLLDLERLHEIADSHQFREFRTRLG